MRDVAFEDAAIRGRFASALGGCKPPLRPRTFHIFR